MKFLITGGAGYIGSTIASAMEDAGHTPVILDSLVTGRMEFTAGRIFYKADIADAAAVEQVFRQHPDIQATIHCAALILVPESTARPYEYYRENVGKSIDLFHTLQRLGYPRVVFSSSGTIYGNQPVQPVSENSIPNPRSPYAVSKLAAEYYVKSIGSLWGIETVCLRVFNAYGPGQHHPPVHTPVIPGFLRQAWENGTIVIHGDGNQTRDFVYLDDVVNAMISAATAPEVDKLTINVGSGKEISARDLAKLVVEVTGGKPEVVFNPRNEGGLSRLCADISLAKEKLEYQPRISLAEGLKITFDKDIRINS